MSVTRCWRTTATTAAQGCLVLPTLGHVRGHRCQLVRDTVTFGHAQSPGVLERLTRRRNARNFGQDAGNRSSKKGQDLEYVCLSQGCWPSWSPLSPVPTPSRRRLLNEA
jgi:hypothetical protein